MLERSFPVSSPDDEILEVTDADIRRKQMSSLDTSSGEGAEPDTAAKRNITCPICMDDESTVSILGSFLARVKRTTKMCSLFCKISAKRLKSNVARFASYIQTSLTTNQLVASCVNTDF